MKMLSGKIRLSFVCFVCFVVQLSSAQNPPLLTPYAQKGKLEIRNVSPSAASVARCQKLELTVELSATYDNPFDPADVALDARVRAPSGKSFLIPGFLYRAYHRELKNGQEFLTPEGPPSWRIRITPVEEGAHEVTVMLRDRTGKVESSPLRFTATAGENPGFVRISQADRRYFAFANGQAYFPIGANVCWAGRGTAEYDEWFKRYGEVGCNYARLWLSPHWSTFALERPGKREEGLGLGQFDLGNAWRIDYVLDLATAKGLRLMLCIDSYNVLREKDAYPQWDSTPHNARQGGPLQRVTDFWTSPVMDKFYRDKLRYLVARYGYSPNVLSWEFWNEVDITSSYRTGPVRDWHVRMARALRELDPYHHLITTSFANTPGDKEIDQLPELDYVQTHHYNNPDLPMTVARAQAQKAAYGKPHTVGEIGADSGGPRTKDDPEGLQVHDPLWSSIVVGCAGTAQPWWWDSLIQPRNLYPLFGSVVRFTAGINWPGEGFQAIKPRVDWKLRPNPMPRRDAVLKDGPVGWTASEFNRPRRVQLTSAGFKGELPVAGIQHGLVNHPQEHNPITFEVDLPQPSRCEVEVGDVSGYGGAALRLTLDGKTALTKVFADPDGGKDGKTLKQYAGAYGLDVPAGKHTVVVENTGPDWFMARYRFRNALEQTGPPLAAWALVGKNTALAWARLEDRTWDRVCVQKAKLTPAPESVLVMPGLAPGFWQAELWDTWTGRVSQIQQIEVGASGEGRVLLPPIDKDLAVKLTRGKG